MTISTIEPECQLEGEKSSFKDMFKFYEPLMIIINNCAVYAEKANVSHKLLFFKKSSIPNQCGSVGWALFRKAKGCRFQSGHMQGLGPVWEATYLCFSLILICLSLSVSLPSPLSLNNSNNNNNNSSKPQSDFRNLNGDTLLQKHVI